MSDVFDKVKRSDVMSRIRGKGNQSTELRLAAAFKTGCLKGWRRHILLKPQVAPYDLIPTEKPYRLTVRPDFVFRAQKLAVFVDGCFWHRCPLHGAKPVANAEFWEKKLAGNVLRDLKATRALEAAGWKVVRVWEHELSDVAAIVCTISNFLEARSARSKMGRDEG